MLLYVVNRRIPLKTFVIMCQPTDTIAKVRATLLHMLYELDKLTHFQLRYNGEYLRDGYAVEDYRLPDNAVVKMIPVSKQPPSYLREDADLKNRSPSSFGSTASSSDSVISGAFQAEINKTLAAEIKIFDQRERLLTDLNVALNFHLFGSLGGFMSSHWYAGIWSTLLTIFAFSCCPRFTRLSGFIGGGAMGTTRKRRKGFLITLSVSCFIFLVASIFLSALNFHQLSFNCGADKCSDTVKYSIFYFSAYAVLLIVTATFAVLLTTTIDIEVGDLVEAKLGQERDIFKVLGVAKNGNLKDQRVAAFELATIAAFSEDNKYLIAGESDGIQTIFSLVQSLDRETSEYGAEALANIVTIQSLQDAVVTEGGIKILTRLLSQSTSTPKLMAEVITTLSFIVSDSHKHKDRVMGTGLFPIADVVMRRHHELTVESLRTVAAIFLEMVFMPQIRPQMLSMQKIRAALLKLASLSIKNLDDVTMTSHFGNGVMMTSRQDNDVALTSLQCIELLVIEEKEGGGSLAGFIQPADCEPPDALPQLIFANLRLLASSSSSSSSSSSPAEEDPASDSTSHNDDSTLTSVMAKICLHLLPPEGLSRDAHQSRGLSRERRVILAHDVTEFLCALKWVFEKHVSSTLRIPNALEGVSRDRILNLSFVSRLLLHSMPEFSQADEEQKKEAKALVEDVVAKSLEAEDKTSWNRLNQCQREMEEW